MNEARLITFDTLQRLCDERCFPHGALHYCGRLRWPFRDMDKGGYTPLSRCNSRNCPVWRRLRKVKP